MIGRAVIWLALVFLLPGQAAAHALQPGFLDLSALGDDAWRVTWRVPDVDGAPMPIRAVLPEQCERRSPSSMRFDGIAHVAVWTTACPGGLAGGSIAVEGLETTATDVLVRFEIAPGEAGTLRLTPTETAARLPVAPSRVDVLKTYLGIGVHHILLGADHLLFVLALLLLVPDRRRLVWAVTSFTVGHSVSLAAATLGFLVLPAPPVEAVIGLSIMFLARELMRPPGEDLRWSETHPGAIAFGFGLLHGLGFARALAEVGLPKGEVPAALLAFNLGVEIGQLAFVAAVLTTAAAAALLYPAVIMAIRQPGTLPRRSFAYGIGAVSATWFLSRLAAF